jgi:hypothetical protein
MAPSDYIPTEAFYKVEAIPKKLALITKISQDSDEYSVSVMGKIWAKRSSVESAKDLALAIDLELSKMQDTYREIYEDVKDFQSLAGDFMRAKLREQSFMDAIISPEPV